jgi:chromosome segregation ATPase
MTSFPSPLAAQSPAPPSFTARPPREAEDIDAKVDKVKDEYEKKLNELSKRLQEEREKLLVTQLRSQEEQATSAKVEISLKELQDRLRRDRREQEQEEGRLKLEKKAQELESRLAQERETWVATLKNQLGARESQEKEVENHFAMRLQEMERRWLEEKANWQKIALGKDDEIRTLRTLAEKLKGADTELSKVASEKKVLEERAAELAKDRAEALARLQNAGEREKEAIQLRADLTLSRQSGAMIQERLERDIASLRASAREREERLMADVERLQRDFATVKQRFDAEKEADLRRAKTEYEADLAQQKQAAERATSELQRLRAVAGALERQCASGRSQLEELKRAAVDWERTQERYKAEFVVLQRKWIEREKEVRAEASAQSVQTLESEKVRLRVQAQDELNQRAAKIADQLRQENESEQRRLESKLRADLEGELQARRQELEAEMGRLRRELAQKDSAWGERLLAKESEALAVRGRADEIAGRFAREEESRQAAERRGLELEKAVQDGREEAGRLSEALRAAQKRLGDVETQSAGWERERTELQRLSTAQAAQIQGTQEAMESTRVQLARETQLGRSAHHAKEQLEKALFTQRQELARALQAQKTEYESRLQELGAQLDDCRKGKKGEA